MGVRAPAAPRRCGQRRTRLADAPRHARHGRWRAVAGGFHRRGGAAHQQGVRRRHQDQRLAQRILARNTREPARGTDAVLLGHARQARPALRQPAQGQHRTRHERQELLLPRLQRDSLRLLRPAHRQQRQEAERERHDARVAQRQARLRRARRRLRQLGCDPLHPQPRAQPLAHLDGLREDRPETQRALGHAGKAHCRPHANVGHADDLRHLHPRRRAGASQEQEAAPHVCRLRRAGRVGA